MPRLQEPGWALLDARAYRFQFQIVASSKTLLPPCRACLGKGYDHIAILLAISAASISRSQHIKRRIAYNIY
jgi:hypothetical protein